MDPLDDLVDVLDLSPLDAAASGGDCAGAGKIAIGRAGREIECGGSCSFFRAGLFYTDKGADLTRSSNLGGFEPAEEDLPLGSVFEQTASMEQEIDCKMPSISR